MMHAAVTFVSDRDGSETIALYGDNLATMHEIQFGGPDGDGFCYHCRSFDCLDNLTPEEREALAAV